MVSKNLGACNKTLVYFDIFVIFRTYLNKLVYEFYSESHMIVSKLSDIAVGSTKSIELKVNLKNNNHNVKWLKDEKEIIPDGIR